MSHDLAPKQLRSFGLLVGGILAIIGLWPTLVRSEEPRLWVLIIAGLLLLPALLWPRSLRAVYRLWMAVGQLLGWMNTRIILGVIFYGLFTPMGLAMRLLHKDTMCRQFEPGADTYRIIRQPRPRSHIKHQF